MPDNPRYSNLCDTMNSMYYLQQDMPASSRFVRLKGQLKIQNQQIPQDILDQNLDKQIQINSFIAWGILFLSVILIASVPCWLMSGKVQIFTKNGWRFLFITIFLLPFLFYQQRTAKSQKQKIKNMLKIQYIKPIFLSTLNFCIWFWCLVYACKFTSMNHALCLSGLKPFYMAIKKIRNKQKFHQFQVAGCFLCVIGIILVCTDSIALPMIFDNQTRKYLKMQPWKRLVFGDTIAALGTICAVYLDQNQKVPGMPRFTHMFFYNIFASFNMITFGYFFGGSDFNLHWRFGIFSLFTYNNFVYVLYPSIILGLFVMICNILAAQIFNQLVINVATCFKLIISSVIMHTLGLQLIMSGITILGFSFIIPGLVFIVGGQGALESKQHKLSFQLYRPPDLFCNTMVDNQGNILFKNHQDNSVQYKNLNQTVNSKSNANIKKSPFQMILEENQNQNNYKNHQKK